MTTHYPKPVVIIGAGIAGFSVVRELRKLDKDMEIIMFTEDSGDYYYKPMLSTALELKKEPAALIMTARTDIEKQLNLKIYHSSIIKSVGTTDKRITLSGEKTQDYSSLVLAIGAKHRIPDFDSKYLNHFHAVNDLSSYARFRRELEGRRSVLICGSGLVGCEFANDLSMAGYDVEVVSSGSHPLSGLAPPEIGEFIQTRLSERGVKWHHGSTLSATDKVGKQYWVQTSDGKCLHTDMVFLAIGIYPNIKLASDSGINVNRGIVVDQTLMTSAENVYAIGDCAEIDGSLLPFVSPIIHCAKVIASNIKSLNLQVTFPVMPIVVKLSVSPTVLCPPPPKTPGSWNITNTECGVKAVYYDDAILRGFALTGDTVQERNSLLKELQQSLAHEQSSV